jgi:Cu-Zn family superoxide dismutase
MERHMGDLGNIEANENGMATLDYVDETVTIGQILGRGIIIHAGEDDLTSQPTGAAGSRVACGVIGIAQM